MPVSPLRPRIALIPRRDLLKRRPDELAIHRMTSHAGVRASDSLPICGGKNRLRSHQNAHRRKNQAKNHAQRTPHHIAFPLPGCPGDDSITGAGGC